MLLYRIIPTDGLSTRVGRSPVTYERLVFWYEFKRPGYSSRRFGRSPVTSRGNAHNLNREQQEEETSFYAIWAIVPWRKKEHSLSWYNTETIPYFQCDLGEAPWRRKKGVFRSYAAYSVHAFHIDLGVSRYVGKMYTVSMFLGLLLYNDVFLNDLGESRNVRKGPRNCLFTHVILFIFKSFCLCDLGGTRDAKWNGICQIYKLYSSFTPKDITYVLLKHSFLDDLGEPRDVWKDKLTHNVSKLLTLNNN